MVTDTDGYIQIIEYLTENLYLFENTNGDKESANTVIAAIEFELGEQIIAVCSQNENLTHNQRNTIICEVDAILYDLEEVLSGVINNTVNGTQKQFISEFSGLIKNLFDSAINSQNTLT
jgi:phage FluMu gp28-like protein